MLWLVDEVYLVPCIVLLRNGKEIMLYNCESFPRCVSYSVLVKLWRSAKEMVENIIRQGAQVESILCVKYVCNETVTSCVKRELTRLKVSRLSPIPS